MIKEEGREVIAVQQGRLGALESGPGGAKKNHSPRPAIEALLGHSNKPSLALYEHPHIVDLLTLRIRSFGLDRHCLAILRYRARTGDSDLAVLLESCGASEVVNLLQRDRIGVREAHDRIVLAVETSVELYSCRMTLSADSFGGQLH